MPVNTSKRIAAGYERAHWSLLNTSGYAIGRAAVLAAGSIGSGAGKLDGVKTSAVAIPEPETVDVTGDDQILGQFIFPPNTSPSFIIDTGISDLDFEALTQTTLVEDTGDISLGVLEPNDPSYPDMTLVLERRSKSKESVTSGLSMWEGIIIPKCTVVPLGSDSFTERAAVTYRYKVSVNVSTKFPWGKAINDTDNGTTGAPIIPFTAENRIHIHSFIADGVEDTFILTYTPASSSLSKVRVYVDGVIQTSGVTVTVVTKTIVFDTPPTDEAVIVVLYEYIV